MSIRNQSRPGRVAAFGIVLVALVIASIVFVSQQIDTAQSATGGAEMGIRVDAADTQDCPGSKTAGETCVGLGNTFHVIISGDAVPLDGTPSGYKSAQVYITWETAGGVIFKPNPATGIVATTDWPDCNVAEGGLSGTLPTTTTGFALQGCLTGLSNPPPSFYKGDLYTFEFTCTSGKSSNEIFLVPLGVDPGFTNGAAFVALDPSLGSNGQLTVPAVTLLVNCTNELGTTPTPTVTPTPTSTPCPEGKVPANGECGTPTPTPCPGDKVPANGECGTPTATPMATPIDLPVISLGAEGVACGATETPEPTPFFKPERCTAQFFPGQEKEGAFIVTINANLLPNAGYGGFQSEVVLSDGLQWNQRANCDDEVVWPDLSGTTCSASTPGQIARHSGRTASAPVFTNSDHVGPLVKLDVYCVQTGEQTLTLTKADSETPFGASYFDEDDAAVEVADVESPDADVLAINCEIVPPDMSLRAVGPGVTCEPDDESRKPTKCRAPFVEEDPESAKFEILIEANAIPVEYGGFQTEVFLNGLKYIPRSCSTEVVWRPDDLAGFVCVIGVSDDEPGARRNSAQTGDFPPFPASRYVGTLVSLQVHCIDGNQAPVSLSLFDSDIRPSGSAFYGTASVGGATHIDFLSKDAVGSRSMDLDGDTVIDTNESAPGALVRVLDVLRINCFDAPTPTVTPTVTATPLESPTPTHTPCPGVCPTATPTHTPTATFTPAPTDTPTQTHTPTSTFTPTPAPPDQQVEEVGPGGRVTTDKEGTGATALDPIETSVTLPVGGVVSILEKVIIQPNPSGFHLFGQQVNISAPSGTAQLPLIIEFTLDTSIIPLGMTEQTLPIFKGGVLVPNCTGSANKADPDPCVAKRNLLTGPAAGDIQITVFTSTASAWNFGQPLGGPITPELGDVNGDGSIDPLDSLWILFSAIDLAELPFPNVADVNGDGNIDAFDSLLILQKGSGLIDDFPSAAGSAGGTFWRWIGLN